MKLRRPSNQSILAVAAIVAGIAAAAGTRGYIDRTVAAERERLRPAQPTVALVVAKRDLRPGDPVGADTMAVRDVPAEFAPGSAITPDRFGSFEGTRLTMPLRSGEPLLQVAIAGADAASFAERLSEGARAITLAVDEVNALSGMLQPGDRIDLMLSARAPDASGDAPDVTVPLMQDVLVLATGRQVRPTRDGPDGSSGDDRSFSAITVEVDPERAQRLIVAQRSGRLTAMLRRPGDRAEIAPGAMDLRTLLPSGRRAIAARAVGPEMIVGGQGELQRWHAEPAGSLLPVPVGGGAIVGLRGATPGAIAAETPRIPAATPGGLRPETALPVAAAVQPMNSSAPREPVGERR